MSSVQTTRVVLDQGVPRDAAALLRALGYQCAHVGELGMSTASDQEIIAWSVQQAAIVITLDADFHTVLAVSGANGPSVVRIRRQGLDAARVVEVIARVLVDYGGELRNGSLVTVKWHKTTCHRLPIGGR